MEGVRQPPLHQQSKYGKQWKSDAGTRRGASLCVGVRLTNRAAPGEELPYSTAALAPMVPLAKSSLGSAAARPWGWGGSAPQAQNNFACRKIGISTTLGASHGNRRAHGPGRRISWWPGGYGIQKRRSYGVPSIGPASPVWGGLEMKSPMLTSVFSFQPDPPPDPVPPARPPARPRPWPQDWCNMVAPTTAGSHPPRRDPSSRPVHVCSTLRNRASQDTSERLQVDLEAGVRN